MVGGGAASHPPGRSRLAPPSPRDFGSLAQWPRTEAEDEAFGRALGAMGDLCALRALMTIWHAQTPPMDGICELKRDLHACGHFPPSPAPLPAAAAPRRPRRPRPSARGGMAHRIRRFIVDPLGARRPPPAPGIGRSGLEALGSWLLVPRKKKPVEIRKKNVKTGLGFLVG